MNNRNVKILSPFVLCCQKVIPLAFDESMSYYECLCGLYNYIMSNLIPAINENADAVTELQNYVAHYFDNLDVQEEINNKLDEMAEDGTLENLIGQYIQLQTTYTYENIESMKTATNLINGSFAKTLGFYEKDDGGASYYYVRNITNSDVVDEKTIIALNDENLIAILLKEKTMSPSQFGAYGDGIHDDTNSINTCIKYTDNILFKNGTYLINPTYDDNSPDDTCINLKSNKIIDFNNSTLTISETDEMLGYIIRCYQENNFTLKNGFIIGYDATEQSGNDSQQMGIAIMDCSNVVIENMNIKNCRGDGVYIREYSNQKKTNNVYVNNCIFKNNRRNQIGYTGGENVKITNCDFIFDIDASQTYTSNWVGIDLERDHDYARFENFYINNCNFKGQPKSAISLSPVDTTVACYGTIENCNIENCTQAITGTRGGRSQDIVYVRNINITGCTLPPINISRGANNNALTFENITLNSFNYTGTEDLNYMFFMAGRSNEGVSNVKIINPVCKAVCPLVFMNNGINNVSIINPIFQNGQSDNSWGVLHGRTASSNLILKDAYNQIRTTITSNYETSNLNTPSNIICNSHTEQLTVTILANHLSEGNEVNIYNLGYYKVSVGMSGQRTITIPEYQGVCRIVKMGGVLMFYGNLTKWENLPQSN